MLDLVPVKSALLSVSDKTDLVAFARRLANHQVKLISTGGTAAALEEAGLEVTPIQEVTDFPEMMNGRIKTLHPRVHGGLLAIRDNPEHLAAMTAHGINAIDLVCVNLYPFEKTIARDDVTPQDAIEQIDIGGPCMIRSAAKNHLYVTCVTQASQYDQVCNDMDTHNGATSMAMRQQLSAAAFTRTAAYDTIIGQWLTQNYAG
jgi:phosphoribosylaminoimidazolecarboxamide formyltransferase/IMP cyclohydrolase